MRVWVRVSVGSAPQSPKNANARSCNIIYASYFNKNKIQKQYQTMI